MAVWYLWDEEIICLIPWALSRKTAQEDLSCVLLEGMRRFSAQAVVAPLSQYHMLFWWPRNAGHRNFQQRFPVVTHDALFVLEDYDNCLFPWLEISDVLNKACCKVAAGLYRTEEADPVLRKIHGRQPVLCVHVRPWPVLCLLSVCSLLYFSEEFLKTFYKPGAVSWWWDWDVPLGKQIHQQLQHTAWELLNGWVISCYSFAQHPSIASPQIQYKIQNLYPGHKSLWDLAPVCPSDLISCPSYIVTQLSHGGLPPVSQTCPSPSCLCPKVYLSP